MTTPPTDASPPDDARPTLVEGRPYLPTLVESVLEAPAHRVSGLRSGGRIGRYRLVKPLKVTSAEADIWVVREQDDGGPTRILKLYRYGLEPKAEISQVLLQLRAEHIVPQIDSGHFEERYYEVQEFLSEGSIADALAEGPLAEDVALNLLDQLADALDHLHDANILHRDIKPANLLVRRWKPFDLVLTDFGISSLAGLSLHLTTVNRTAAYSAPEALTGVVAKASDWWSVGVVLIEALTGRHPFADMTEQAINFQLVSKGMPIPDAIPGRWRLLLRGLLVRNHRQRWGMDEIRAWRSGEDNLSIPQETDPFALLGHPGAPRTRPYHFGATTFETPEDLAAALAENWTEALKHFHRGFVTDWVRNDLRNQELANTLLDIAQDPELGAEERLIVALMALNPELPPVFQGEIICPDWFVQHPADAVNLLRGNVPTWLERLRQDSWMRNLRLQRREGMRYLAQADIQFNEETASALLFSESRAVTEAARQLQERYVEARLPSLNRLLLQPELSVHEAVLLLSAHRGYYRTWQQVQEKSKREFIQQVTKRFQTHHIAFSADRLDALVEKNHDQVIEQADAYRKQFTASAKSALTRLLEKNRLELVDALMLLSADPVLLLDAARAQKWRASEANRETLQRLEETQIDLDWTLAERLMENPDELSGLVRRHQRRFRHSTLEKLDDILHSKKPDTFESLLLVCAHHRYFHSPSGVVRHHLGGVIRQTLHLLWRYPITSACSITLLFVGLVWVLPYYILLVLVFLFLFIYIYALVIAPPDSNHPDSPYYRERRAGNATTPGIPPPPPAHLRRPVQGGNPPPPTSP